MLTSFLHLSIGIFAHSSPAKASSFVVLDGFHAAAAFFKCHQRFSFGFKSGEWEDHYRTFQDLFLNQALVHLEVCLGLFCQQKASSSSFKMTWYFWESRHHIHHIHDQEFQVLPQKDTLTSSMIFLHAWPWGWYSSVHTPGLSHARHTVPCGQD